MGPVVGGSVPNVGVDFSNRSGDRVESPPAALKLSHQYPTQWSQSFKETQMNANEQATQATNETKKSTSLYDRAADFGQDQKEIQAITKAVKAIKDRSPDLDFSLDEVVEATMAKITSSRRKTLLSTGNERKRKQLEAKKAKMERELRELEAKLGGIGK